MQKETEKKIYYALRIVSALCFIGHGSFGIITKEVWCNYFAVFGIGHDTAFSLMPYVGIVDICMGILILLYPLRIVVGWLIVWGTITAFLRPLSGEPFAEFIERAGNYGAPLALLLLTYTGERNFKHWLKPIKIENIQTRAVIIKRVSICLRVVVLLLFIGHGWLNLIEKQSILDQYKALGFSNSANVAHIVGSFEILAAFSVLIRPLSSVLLILFVWKMSSELFYPHWEFFEFIERSGSYGAILALWFLARSSFLFLIKKEAKASVAAV
ncbi:MAG: hypothetical protein ABI405_07385 [Parafilimonas sp.]